jgi:hypothetical protein
MRCDLARTVRSGFEGRGGPAPQGATAQGTGRRTARDRQPPAPGSEAAQSRGARPAAPDQPKTQSGQAPLRHLGSILNCCWHQSCSVPANVSLRPVLRIRIIQQPPVASIDGVRLDCFATGVDYEVGNSIGALFLAEGWAVPVPLDAPVPPTPFSDSDPFEPRLLDRQNPPNLVRDSQPPYLDHATAADYKWRRRPRR